MRRTEVRTADRQKPGEKQNGGIDKGGKPDFQNKTGNTESTADFQCGSAPGLFLFVCLFVVVVRLFVCLACKLLRLSASY